MEKYTDKIRNIYQEILALDTIYNILSWYDRTSLHKKMNGEIMVYELSEKALMLNEFVRITGWKSPHMKYGQDRLLYFYDEGSEKDRPIEEYQTIFTKVTNDLNYIQNEHSKF